jgi:peptidoglycan hydrolase FlgJ
MASGPDIIMGVSRAADMARQRQATARLEQLSRGPTSVADASPAASVLSTGSLPSDTASDWEAQVRLASANASRASTPAAIPRATDRADKPADAYVQFEAVLLQNMVESMLPQDSEMFGSGTAGNVWKSMLAEKVAAEIARTGSLGIAKQIAAGEAARTAAGHAVPPKATDA